ncbi:MAG: cation:proton antiporter [Acidobacteriaceae bacterium]|nr:cation:proton antiporter [Acidobacteriaceae bacterium]MBV9501130.1 cation:proton antiporter [Acidobacteriaceae bacterium]
MHVATNILVVGTLVFLAHAFTGVFSRTRIPDVLLLTIIGILLGPILHLVTPASFGAIGPVFSAVTLIIILFEAGLSLDLDVLRGAIRPTLTLTLANFLLTMISVGLVGWYLMGSSPRVAFMLGAIIGSTSPAVIVPLTRKLAIAQSTRTTLFLESAVSDVISIVVAIGIMDSFQFGKLRVGQMIGQIIATLILAGLFGALSAFIWSALLLRVRALENSIFTTPAFVFVLFGIVELLGFSGYVAAVVFGAVLGNIEVFHRIPWLQGLLPSEPITLNQPERDFLGEVVFLLKTFFFIYVGVSIKFTDLPLVYVAIALTGLIFLIRIPSAWLALDRTTPIRDASLVAIMSPKGLAAVVLASMPLEANLPGGRELQAITYSVVFASIVFTSLLSFLIERTFLAKIYATLFRQFGRVEDSRNQLSLLNSS